jgi:hypothetical protein
MNWKSAVGMMLGCPVSEVEKMKYFNFFLDKQMLLIY